MRESARSSRSGRSAIPATHLQESRGTLGAQCRQLCPTTTTATPRCGASRTWRTAALDEEERTADARLAWQAAALRLIRASAPLPSGVGQRRAALGGATLRRRTARLSDACARIIVLAQRHSDASHHTTRLHPRGDQGDAQAVPRRLWHSVAGDQPALQVSEHTLRPKPRQRRMGLQRHERAIGLHRQERSMATTEQPTERRDRHSLATVVADPVLGYRCVFRRERN
jgi:hypothetical protein